MITLLYGQNDYALQQELRRIIQQFSVKEAIERRDGSTVSPEALLDLLQGGSLFAQERLIIFSDLASNKTAWGALAEYIEMVPEEIHLVLIESALDKRTKTYKLLQKFASVQELKLLSEPEAERWLPHEAKSLAMEITSSQVSYIVRRMGTDQWQLYSLLEKLQFIDEITKEVIDSHSEVRVEANVFALIDVALEGDIKKVQQLVGETKQSQDPYQFFGLFSSQLFQLITLAVSKKPSSDVAKDLGVHPYPLQKVSALAKHLSLQQIRDMAHILSDCDNKIKRSGVEPWLLIEQALLKLAQRS